MKDDATRLLEWLQKDYYDNDCENFTSGIGACYEEGRSPVATYAEAGCCVPCSIHRFRTKGELPRPRIDIEAKVVDGVTLLYMEH